MTAEREPRRDPSLASLLVLAIAFVALLVVGVVTVIVPEIESADVQGAAPEEPTEAPTAPPPSPTPAPAP